MSAYQMGCTTASAPVIDPLLECSAHACVAGKSQVIVAAEVQQLSPVYLQRAALGAFYNPPLPIAVLPLAFLKALFDIAKTGQINRVPLPISSNGDSTRGYHRRRQAYHIGCRNTICQTAGLLTIW